MRYFFSRKSNRIPPPQIRLTSANALQAHRRNRIGFPNTFFIVRLRMRCRLAQQTQLVPIFLGVATYFRTVAITADEVNCYRYSRTSSFVCSSVRSFVRSFVRTRPEKIETDFEVRKGHNLLFCGFVFSRDAPTFFGETQQQQQQQQSCRDFFANPCRAAINKSHYYGGP